MVQMLSGTISKTGFAVSCSVGLSGTVFGVVGFVGLSITITGLGVSCFVCVYQKLICPLAAWEGGLAVLACDLAASWGYQ